ncbi:MAG: SPFH domain-containing protein [Treponema sp.]|nr:SPFH domain-containing protein [Treponema sp.]MCL2251758.1 SPFH domain-containing protein [Treponema sp.]
MIIFAFVLGTLVGITVIVQLITNMKIVGGNELGVITGSGRLKGFRTFSGGRAFVIPLFQKFSKFDLTPITIEVVVESAIAAGIVPLNVKATVSFAIASNEAGRSYAVTRILNLASNRKELAKIAGDIIEGHLRDSIASVTPEQVMKDKDALVSKMINVCKADLENIGLQITTMNIADVDDHRLPGVEEPDLYIALLKRIQSANAETRARSAQAESKASAAEQAHARRAETEVKNLRNELDRLKAQVRVSLAQQAQRQQVGVEQASADAKARVAGVTAELEAEKQMIELLRNRYKAEIVTPAIAFKEKAVLDAKAEVASWFEVARKETEQLEVTLKTIQDAGKGKSAWLIENFNQLFKPFTETLAHYPVDHVSVITGVKMDGEPISAIHPNAAAKVKNEIVENAMRMGVVDRPSDK